MAGIGAAIKGIVASINNVTATVVLLIEKINAIKVRVRKKDPT